LSKSFTFLETVEICTPTHTNHIMFYYDFYFYLEIYLNFGFSAFFDTI
jgi:hypothetical protein